MQPGSRQEWSLAFATFFNQPTLSCDQRLSLSTNAETKEGLPHRQSSSNTMSSARQKWSLAFPTSNLLQSTNPLLRTKAFTSLSTSAETNNLPFQPMNTTRIETKMEPCISTSPNQTIFVNEPSPSITCLQITLQLSGLCHRCVAEVLATAKHGVTIGSEID